MMLLESDWLNWNTIRNSNSRSDDELNDRVTLLYVSDQTIV